MAVQLSPTGQVLQSLSSVANAQNSQSTSVADSWGSSWGQSASRSYDNMDAWSLASSEEASESTGSSYGYNQTFGREASAADIERAAEANQIQRDLWQAQADYNAKQAEIDREFQREMSNTAYQRAVADLKRAGLNPILAALNMGASTPAGAMASSGLATSHKATTYPESIGYSSSANSAWSRGKSGSASKTTGRGGSESYSNNGSSEGSHSESQSTTTTQLKDMINFAGELWTAATNAAEASKAPHISTGKTDKSGYQNIGMGMGERKKK